LSRYDIIEEGHAALTLALNALDEVGRLRAEVAMAQRRLALLLQTRDVDKTPVRPPSVTDLSAVERTEKKR
jgi:hypothetical protein